MSKRWTVGPGRAVLLDGVDAFYVEPPQGPYVPAELDTLTYEIAEALNSRVALAVSERDGPSWTRSLLDDRQPAPIPGTVGALNRADTPISGSLYASTAEAASEQDDPDRPYDLDDEFPYDMGGEA